MMTKQLMWVIVIVAVLVVIGALIGHDPVGFLHEAGRDVLVLLD